MEQVALDIAREVRTAMDGVLDPCGRFNRSWVSLNDLGMVEDGVVDNHGGVEIALLLDDPGCVYLNEIVREINGAVGQIDGVTAVEVRTVYDRIWTEDRVSEEGRAKLCAARDRAAGAGLLQIAPFDASTTGTPPG